MKTVHFDCFSGVSGDMVLGGLLDAGAPVDGLLEMLHKMPVSGFSVRVRKEKRGAIEGTRVLFRFSGQPRRAFRELEAIIQGSELASGVTAASLKILRTLGEAEARVHGVPVEEVHFHEIGALDTLLDVVGTAAALHLLEVSRVTASAIPLGSGWVKTEHGTLPIPAPATAVLMEGIPVFQGTERREVTTPTGAAIVRALCEAFGPIPSMILERVGYGIGSHPQEDPPNLLRVFLGRASEVLIQRRLLVLETQIDDMNPEFYDHLLSRLFAEGALDATFTPVHMKKNRPGILVSVLAEPASGRRLMEVLFLESSTLGVRAFEVERYELPRVEVFVTTPYGKCRVKEVVLPDGSRRRVPEYEDCRQAAERHKVPLREVYEAVLFNVRKLLPIHEA